MKRYYLQFTGRRREETGEFYDVSLLVVAKDMSSAVLSLYETHDRGPAFGAYTLSCQQIGEAK